MPRVNEINGRAPLFSRRIRSVVAASLRRCLAFLFAVTAVAVDAQLQSNENSDAVRVTVSQNQDGSRTAYEIDSANHKAIATTTGAGGKLLGKIRYRLDDAGRFATGEVFGPDQAFRYKTAYKYDPTGRLLEETQLTKDDVVKLKLVYSYDSSGKQAGYSVYDAAGKLLGQTTPASTTGSTPKKKAR